MYPNLRRVRRRPARARRRFGRRPRSPDGRLWFVNDAVGAGVRPGQSRAKHGLRHRCTSSRVVADRTVYPAGAAPFDCRRSLAISRSTTSASASSRPQKVRFRYRLDGRDDDVAGAGNAPSGVLQRSPPGHVPVPRDRQQQRRRLERGRRVARDRHRTGVVPDAGLRGAERPASGAWPCGSRTACGCGRWHAPSTRASMNVWWSGPAWPATCTTRCCRPCRAARWSPTPRWIDPTTRRRWRAR